MGKCPRNGRNGNVNFLLRCAENPTLDGSRLLQCITCRFQVDQCQQRMHKGAKAPSARPINVVALQNVQVDAGFGAQLASFRAAN
jgi:hypothetical protein